MFSIPDTRLPSQRITQSTSLWFWAPRRGSVCCFFCCCIFCAALLLYLLCSERIILILFLFFQSACARLLACVPGSPACPAEVRWARCIAAVRWTRCRLRTRLASIPKCVAFKMLFSRLFCVLVLFFHFNFVFNFFAS